MAKLISVIVPLYNEEEVLHESYRRLSTVLSAMEEDYELIFINDGSRDKTFSMAKAIQEKDKHVVLIDFARNFGHQIAVTAGLDQAKGDAVVIIDADLQDPPELIPKMVEMWKNGAEVVYGKRVSRRNSRCVRSFYEDYFANLYEGRTTLNEAYGVSFDEMTEEEFRQFYVELYEFVTYDEMLDHFAEIAYNYESLETPLEEGTYTLKGDRIRCTATGEYDSGDIKAMVTGDNDEHLVLTYSDGVENYDRAD